MHLYEETTIGNGDMWQKDAMIYNLNKFKMDKNLLGISDEDLEQTLLKEGGSIIQKKGRKRRVIDKNSD